MFKRWCEWGISLKVSCEVLSIMLKINMFCSSVNTELDVKLS